MAQHRLRRRRVGRGLSYDAYAKVYDGEYEGFEDDVPFYAELAEGKDTLELGCGTGRVSIRLAEMGHRVWAVDLSEAMLEVARSKQPEDTEERLTFLQGDMRFFKLEKRFDLIIVPFHSFMHLHTIADQLMALVQMRHHLKGPDSRIVINLLQTDPRTLPDRHTGAATVVREMSCDHVEPNTSHKVRVSSATSFDTLSQLIYDERIYETVDHDGLILRRRVIEQVFRHFDIFEFQHLLARAGLMKDALYRDYEFEEYDGGTGEVVWVARPMTDSERKLSLELM